MSQIACVSIPSLSLQLLTQREPQWFDYPLAVVTEEKPTGIILELNLAAKTMGVRTGMRFSSALTLAPNLHAAAVSDDEISDGVTVLVKLLHDLCPEIEPFELCPGVFWMNAAGFDRLFGGAERWVDLLRQLLERHGYVSRISVGFTRFGTYLAAKQAKEPIIFESMNEETNYARFTPLSLLPMPPKASKMLKNLGVNTIGAFIDLPPGGVRKRFPKSVSHWYKFASDREKHPIQPTELREELVLVKYFQPEIKNLTPVFLHFRELLDHLLTDVMKHNEFVHSLNITLGLEDGSTIKESVSPSKPTVRSDTLYRLLTLRLSGLKIPCSIGKIELSAERLVQKSAQELLFQDSQTRDREEGEKAFSLIKAELGNTAVQYAVIRDEHRPEERVAWKNCISDSNFRKDIEPPMTDGQFSMVRRMYNSCGELEDRELKRVRKLAGPVRLSTGWWDDEVNRDYHFIEDNHGTIHWTYKNRDRNTWVFQGYVS